MSYAAERANTAKKWLDLTQKFSGKEIDFNFTNLKDMAQLRITDALSSATYANLLGANASEAEELLESARNNYENGLYSSALFNAVMAKAQVDIILGTTGLDNEEIKNKVEIIEKEAMKKIQESQVYGALPVMAMNYYEYGLSFKEDSPTIALIYLVYAKHFARVSKNLLEVFEGKYFGFQTENITITPNHYVTATETKIEYYAITLTAGAVLGFITGISIKRKKRRIR